RHLSGRTHRSAPTNITSIVFSARNYPTISLYCFMDSTILFEKERPRLTKIAYSMLGSLSDAEDMVQETFLRWEDTIHTTMHKPAAYLATVVSRQCLDQLKSARVQREQYIGPWLPEPLVDENTDYYSELSHDLSIAFLHTLEQLTPLQRAVFLLHDIFNYTFKEVAHILDRKPAACRKTAQRARQYLQKKQPVSLHAQDENQEKVKRFIDALQARDINQIE